MMEKGAVDILQWALIERAEPRRTDRSGIIDATQESDFNDKEYLWDQEDMLIRAGKTR